MFPIQRLQLTQSFCPDLFKLLLFIPFQPLLRVLNTPEPDLKSHELLSKDSGWQRQVAWPQDDRQHLSVLKKFFERNSMTTFKTSLPSGDFSAGHNEDKLETSSKALCPELKDKMKQVIN